MSWIKRNLYFLAGAIVAVVLLVVSVFFLLSKYSQNDANLEELKKASADLEHILGLPVGPGNEKIDNIANAHDQQKQVQTTIRTVQKNFVAITPIPDPADVSARKEDFASAFRSSLRRTIDQLQRDAADNSVALTQGPTYAFSFKLQRDQYNFTAGSLGPLSVQLGEVKAICEILFQAKINSLDNLQRERVSADEGTASPTDYLELAHASVTNDQAILTPYVITLHCFSSELAGVLSGFAANPHGFIVKAVNVEPASGSGAPDATSLSTMAPAGYPGYGVPGMGAPAPVATTATPRGGLPVVLDEKPLKVTLVLNVVKLLARK